MTPEETRSLIPQYLSGALSTPDHESFERILESSAELRAEVEELRTVWENLALLPQEQPSAALRARFYQRLNAVERDRSALPARALWRWKLWPQVALGVLIFAAGLFLGSIRSGERARTDEVAKMSSQVQNLRELVALSLLERQSAASRMEGVAYSSGIDQPNEQVISALLQALNHDANVNVRLSSIDALERFAKNKAISKSLIDSIEHQDSPLVQIALIDSLVNGRNHSVAGELKRLTAAADINPAVRQRAQWGLQKLSIE